MSTRRKETLKFIHHYIVCTHVRRSKRIRHAVGAVYVNQESAGKAKKKACAYTSCLTVVARSLFQEGDLGILHVGLLPTIMTSRCL
jgi:hypothetical protein